MPADQSIILVAEDDEDDRLILRVASEKANLDIRLEFVANGQELLDYLFNRNGFEDCKRFPRPSLIVLDLKMPYKNGFEALQEIKADSTLRKIPIVVLTTSQASEDRSRCERLGANDFVTKSASLERMTEILRGIAKLVSLPKKRGMELCGAGQETRLRSSVPR